MKPVGGSARRIGIVVRWPIGMALAAWRYIWRTTPVYRLDEEGSPDDMPPPLPAAVDRDRLLEPGNGAGPLFHRQYRTAICQSKLSPEELVSRICGNPNAAAPGEVAVFTKIRGDEGQMSVGDEYLIRMPGPWDGPVRVVSRTPTSFRFATMQSHLEAGQIEFSADTDGCHVGFTIESWAASGDRLADFLYDGVGAAKEMQLHMWMHFLSRTARLAGGRMTGGVRVHTRRFADVPRG